MPAPASRDCGMLLRLHGSLFPFYERERNVERDMVSDENKKSPPGSHGPGFPETENRPSGSPYTEDGRFLKNPLPVPKRRGHIQMDFDLPDAEEDWDLPEDRDYFDIDIEDDDDFDL